MGATIVRRRLGTAVAALFVLRVLLSLVRVGPLVVADEVGYLTNARVIVGEQPGQMTQAPFYRGGYSAVIAPILAVTHDPRAAYALVLVVNAALAACVLPLLYVLLRRGFAVPAATAFWASLVAAVYPSITTYTQVALSENLLVPLTLVWLVALVFLLDARPGREQAVWAAVFAAAAAGLLAVHGRMIVAVVATGAAVAIAVVVRRLAWASAGLAAVVLGAGVAGVHFFDAYLIRRNYGGHAPDEVGQRLGNLESAGGVAATLRNLVGQSWYIAVATLGLVVAVALADVPRLVHAFRGRRVRTPHALAVFLLVTTAGLLAVSALSFRTLDRPDMLVYGRYVDVVVPPLLALALARLTVVRAPLLRVALVLGGATALVAVLRATTSPPGAASRWNVASLPFLTFDLGAGVVVGAGIVAVLACTAFAILRHRAPTLVVPALLVAFLATTAAVERDPIVSTNSGWYGDGWTSPQHAAAGTQRVAFDVDNPDGLYVYQWFLPHDALVLFSASATHAPAAYVLTTADWAAHHRALHPHVLWSDTSHDHRGHVLIRLGRPIR